MSICDRCTEEVEDDDVQCCATCDRDGLCPRCLDDHDCDATITGGR